MTSKSDTLSHLNIVSHYIVNFAHSCSLWANSMKLRELRRTQLSIENNSNRIGRRCLIVMVKLVTSSRPAGTMKPSVQSQVQSYYMKWYKWSYSGLAVEMYCCSVWGEHVVMSNISANAVQSLRLASFNLPSATWCNKSMLSIVTVTESWKWMQTRMVDWNGDL